MDIHFEDQVLKVGPDTYALRRARVRDVDEMLQLERSVYSGQTPWDRMAFLSELRKTNMSLYLTLWQGDKLVAFIGCWFTKNESHITNIAVAPSFQNQGVGRALMAFMINLAKAWGSLSMTLEVRTTNAPAKALYHGLGFVDGPLKRGYYVLDYADAMDMRLELTQFPKENDF